MFDLVKPSEKHYKISLEYAINEGIDVIHDHPGEFIVASEIYSKMKNKLDTPIVTTIHINQIPNKKLPLIKEVQEEGRPVYFVCISNSHKNILEREIGIEGVGVVYNGIPVEKYDLVEKDKKQNYLFWIGRIRSEKGTDLAIQTAKKSGLPLIIAGEVHKKYEDFYKDKVETYLTRVITGKNYLDVERKKDDLVERIKNGEEIVREGEVLFTGPLNDRQKGVVSGHACSLLMLNRWEEPFGLVMPESMATGTPVIGTNLGAIPELVEDGTTGYVIPVNYVDGKIDEEVLVRDASYAVEKIGKINPFKCREHVEKNFSRQSMAEGYLNLYREVLESPVKEVVFA